MTEEFLYHIWQFKRFCGPLIALDGSEIKVLSPGQQNSNAGPDFLHARIKIDNVLWVGNVEIHTKTSDWHFHGHDNDENYQRLILHVVYTHDLDTLPHDCPLLELSSLISEELVINYRKLINSNSFIPCENLFSTVDEFTKCTFVESLFVQRLQTKSDILNERLLRLNGHWEALLFERIAYVFGLHVNGTAFELLAKSFPFSVLQNIQRKEENLEAFLFGQAGFLVKPKDEYQMQLTEEYDFLRHKYNTIPIDNYLFKFLRLRPTNFPTIRIAQLACLYQSQNKLFSMVMQARNIKQITSIFDTVLASGYWDTHYSFGKLSQRSIQKNLSSSRIHLIILNAIIPIKFLYSKQQEYFNFEQLLSLVREMKPENNSIINNYRKIGANIQNAVDSQAYLELKKTFCKPKNCLHCKIGNKIMNNVR